MPNVSEKILGYKLWGVGYQRLNTNERNKKQKNAHKHTNKKIQIIK